MKEQLSERDILIQRMEHTYNLLGNIRNKGSASFIHSVQTHISIVGSWLRNLEDDKYIGTPEFDNIVRMCNRALRLADKFLSDLAEDLHKA